MTLINYSEFNTLTDCERKFVYAYLLKQEEEGAKRGMYLGTLCHIWHSSWLRGEGAVLLDSWTDDIEPGGKPGDARTISLSDFEPELVTRATWLAGRFVEHYGPVPPSSWTVISAEEWMTREFTWGALVGRSDGWVDIDGELTLVEVKSYGSRPGPLAYAQVSPQLGCYSLLAEAKYGQRPDNILYQGIYTHQWKLEKPTQGALIAKAIAHDTALINEGKHLGDSIVGWTKKAQTEWARNEQLDESQWTQRPAAESFDQLEVELGDHHLRTAELYLQAAVARRRDLTDPGSPALTRALPSVGAHCSYCGFKAQCWMDLGGVEPMEIEVEDDDAEPV